MNIVTENGRPRSLDEQLRHLVDTHGLYALVRSLANLARWRAHHHLSHGRQPLANLWQRASAALHCLNHLDIQPLDDAQKTQQRGGA